jgi:hypothetical protein
MLKSISTFAALMAAGIAALPPLSPQVRARGPVPRASSATGSTPVHAA